jgi:hypothetical protein
LAVLFLIIAFLNLYYLTSGDDLLAEIVVICIYQILPILFIGGAIAGFTFITTLSKRNKTMLSKQTLTITEPAFICESEFSRSEVKGAALQRIVRSQHYAFFYISELGAILIPKRAFSSPSEWNTFLLYCQEKSRAR